MSGSIGANRIPTKLVKPTVDDYINTVLKPFPGYKNCDTTGSYNVIMQLGQEKKEGHGDIDLAVQIEASDLKKLKKDFKAYCEKLPDNVTVPFKDGKRKGDKAQLFGAIVTIAFPIHDKPEECVQIDNILVTTEKDLHFQKSFLDMNAQKQALFQGLVRVLLQHEDKKPIWDHFGFKGFPEPDKNQEYEFVLSTAGLSLRLISLTNDRKEDTKKRVELWRSNDWDDVEWLMRDYDFKGKYEDELDIVAKRITDERSRSRIVGIIKSMIHVGPGEVGTPKGEAKEAGIKLAAEKLEVKLENKMVSLKNYIIEHLVKKNIDTNKDKNNIEPVRLAHIDDKQSNTWIIQCWCSLDEKIKNHTKGIKELLAYYDSNNINLNLPKTTIILGCKNDKGKTCTIVWDPQKISIVTYNGATYYFPRK